MLPTPRDLLKNDSDPILETIRDISGAVESVQRRVAQTTSFASEQGINIVAGEGDLFDDSGTSPFTGTAMVYPPYVDASGNEWHFLGINDGVLQFAVSATDGKAYAGAGAVTLDENGISIAIDSGTDVTNSNSIKFLKSGTEWSRLTGYDNSGENYLFLQTNSIAAKPSTVSIRSLAPTTYQATISLLASGQTASNILAISYDSDTAANCYTKINALLTDSDTMIYGVSATPILTVDAGASAISVNGGTGIGALTAGTYTPTLTNATNVASSTAFSCQYMRVGNIVTVSGEVTIDPTAAGAAVLRMTFPIASNITAIGQAGGIATTAGAAGVCIAILADIANDAASFQWVAVDTTSRNYFFTFTYQVI